MEQLNENMRKFPIKFYENPDGSIHYENAFIDGDAKNINDAFNHFKKQDLTWDLPYYYEDVIDVNIGSYEPSLIDKKYKGRKYLGKLNLELEINTDWGKGEHSVTYLSKHRDEIPNHEKWMEKLKREEARQKFFNKLKDGLKNVYRKVAGLFNRDKYQYEMFSPDKTRYDLICSHCGNIIPKGSYFEEYHSQNYHIECMWDMFFNQNTDKDYQTAKSFFYSLQKYLRLWPFHGLDTKEDYKFDLDLVKSNDRRFKD